MRNVTKSLCLGLLLTAAMVCNAAGINVSDFQVNDESFPGTFQQDAVSVSQAADGSFVVAWRDFRDGEGRGYYQLFDAAGQPLGVNREIDPERLIDDDGGPMVAMNPAGQFAVCYRSWIDKIWARFFSATGEPLGEPFVLADDTGEWGGFEELAIALNDPGHGVMVSRGEHDGDATDAILGQLFDLSTGVVGDLFQIDQNGPPIWNRFPEVVIDDSDRIYCTYSPYVELSSAAVALALFDYGDPATVVEIIVDSYYTVPGEYKYEVNKLRLAYQSETAIGVLWTGTYWEELAPQSWNYLADTSYLSVYDASGVPVAERVPLVDDQVFAGYNWCPDLAVTASGFAILTVIYSSPEFHVLEVDKYGVPLSGQQTYVISDDSEYKSNVNLFYPAGDRLVCIWEADPYYGPLADIYAQGFYLDGSEAFAMARVHDDLGAWQNFPAVATNYLGNALVVWIDYRESLSGDPYGQVFDPAGNPIGDNFKISDNEPGGGFCKQLEIVSNGVDRAVAVWTGHGESRAAVRAQAFDMPYFTKTGDNFIIYEPDYNLKDFWPDVGVAADRSVVFTWRHRQGSSDYIYDTYYQAYDANLSPLMSAAKVNDSDGAEICWGCEGLYFHMAPRIAVQADGSFAIAWQEVLDGSGNSIAAQFYDGYLAPSGANVLVSDNASGVETVSNEEIPPDVAVNQYGEYAFAWTGGHNSYYYGAWARVFDSDGNPLGPQVRYSDHHVFNYDVTARISAGPDHTFLANWYTSGVEDPDIHAQKINTACELIGVRMRIDNAPSGFEQSYPSVIVHDNTVIFAWQDYRNDQSNTDIFCRYVDWSELGSSYGDVNLDGTVNVTDAVYLVQYIFAGGPEPVDYLSGDTNCDGLVNITDVVFLINYIFAGGPEPDCS